MVIRLPGSIEDRLRIMAQDRGRSVELLVEEAVRQYLDACAITDVTPEDLGGTQMRLAGELKHLNGDHPPEEAA